jgi:hypothetical protein
MVCTTCGARIVDGVNFCARCGAAVAAAPFQEQEQPMYAAQPSPVAGHYGTPYQPVPRSRVQRNLQTLGILWCVYAAYRVVAGLIGMFFLRTFAGRNFGGPGWPFVRGFGDSGPHWMTALLPVVFVVTVVAVALSVFVGWSLLNRKPWGRTLAIVAAVLALLKFPFGTALGIYTLWVMAPGESGMEWEAIADRS